MRKSNRFLIAVITMAFLLTGCGGNAAEGVQIALSDDEIMVDLKETDEGIEFFALFDGLEYANREERISMAEEVIGVTANDSDTTFRFSEIDSELKALGFDYGA